MKTYNSCVVTSSVDDVWNTLSNFHDMAWADGVITSLDIVGDKGGKEVGAKRLLNGAISETLATMDNDAKEFTYSIDDGPAVLSKDELRGYFGKVQVSPITIGEGTLVQWSSQWTSNNKGVQEFCDPIYTALMTCVKDHFS